MSVDFDAVMRNAAAEGIDLQQVAIKYEGLTADELKMLKAQQVVTHDLGNGAVLAKFPLEGAPVLQAKASGVMYLAA